MRASALKSRTKWDPDPNCSRTETTWPPPRCSSVARRLRLETLPPASRSEHGRRRRVGRLSPRGRGHSRLQPGSPTRGAVRPPGPPRWGQGLLQHPPPHPGLASPHPVYLRDGSPRPRPEVRTRRFPARRRQEGVSPQRGQVGPFHRLPRPARLTPTGERGTAGPQRRRRFPPRRLPLAGSNRSVTPPPPLPPPSLRVRVWRANKGAERGPAPPPRSGRPAPSASPAPALQPFASPGIAPPLSPPPPPAASPPSRFSFAAPPAGSRSGGQGGGAAALPAARRGRRELPQRDAGLAGRRPKVSPCLPALLRGERRGSAAAGREGGSGVGHVPGPVADPRPPLPARRRGASGEDWCRYRLIAEVKNPGSRVCVGGCSTVRLNRAFLFPQTPFIRLPWTGGRPGIPPHPFSVCRRGAKPDACVFYFFFFLSG